VRACKQGGVDAAAVETLGDDGESTRARMGSHLLWTGAERPLPAAALSGTSSPSAGRRKTGVEATAKPSKESEARGKISREGTPAYVPWFYGLFLVVTLTLAYELFARRYLPGLSLGGLLHSLGLTAEEPRPLEPGKGFGHTLGYAGSAMMLVTLLYPLRNRSERLARIAPRKLWLDIHIFFGLLGPMLITFHTTFKIGGLVSVSFWSMVVVVISGVIGRFIYIQIPRGIAGNELTVEEAVARKRRLLARLSSYVGDEDYVVKLTDRIAGPIEAGRKPLYAILSFLLLDSFRFRLRLFRAKRELFRKASLDRTTKKETAELLRSLSLVKRRIILLEKSQELLEYWRPIHLRLSIVMFVFMAIHVFIAFFFYVKN